MHGLQGGPEYTVYIGNTTLQAFGPHVVPKFKNIQELIIELEVE